MENPTHKKPSSFAKRTFNVKANRAPAREVLTRHGPTVHEDIGEQFNRLSGELWKEYAEKLRASEGSTYRRMLHLVMTNPDEDRLSTLQTFRNAQVHSTGPSTWRSVVEVLAEKPSELGPEFRIFHQYLHAWTDVFITNATRATSETSTLINFLHAAHRGAAPRSEKHQLPHATEWTDKKNQRRCELVDKEIEGTLSPAEQVELEKLQTEMLAYRRNVVPLPLDKLRELHQALLREAGDRME
ncbi:MAG: hypothetical protein ACREX4_21235 [Gammaproteobacteria bacterium]